MQQNNEKMEEIRNRKKRFIKEVAPTLTRSVVFPDIETVVEHTLVRATMLANEFEKKGFFDSDDSLPEFETYLMFSITNCLSNMVSHDPATAVEKALRQGTLLAEKIYGIAMDKIVPVVGAPQPAPGGVTVVMTPTNNNVQHTAF